MGCCFGESDDKTELKPRLRTHRGKCTDCLCFFIFIIFLIGMGLITALSVLDNGFNRVIHGYDSHGNICGDSNELHIVENSTAKDNTGYEFVFYFDWNDPKNAQKVCVKSCPNINIESEEGFLNYTKFNVNNLCEDGTELGVYDKKKCPPLPIIKSIPILNRCVPDIDQFVSTQLEKSEIGSYINEKIKENTEVAKLSVLNLYEYLPKLGLVALASLAITIILVFALRYIAKIVIYLIMLIASGGCIALSVFLWLRYIEIYKLDLISYTTIPFINYSIRLLTAYLIYAISMTILTLVLLLVIFVMRKRIGLVIRLVCEAQKALTDIPLLFMFPLLTFVKLIIFLVYWSLTAMMIYSYGDYNDNDLKFFGLTMKKELMAKIMWIYHVVALVWVCEFIFACQNMVVSGSVAKWYFTRDKDNIGSPIFGALKRTLIYHLGSVAFGSCIITLIRIPRYILMGIQKKLKSAGPTSCLANCLKCCTCCLWFLDNCMQYINANSYTIIVIEGISFCAATKKSFKLIINNAARVAMINTVGDFLLFLCKIAVAALSVGIAILLLKVDDIDLLKLAVLPLLVSGVIGYLIAHCFFTIYEMVIDALMICFCEDIEANDGTAERPYYMSKSLKEFVDDSDRTSIIIGKE